MPAAYLYIYLICIYIDPHKYVTLADCINNIRLLIKYAFRYASSKKTYMEKQLDLKMKSVDFGSQILFYGINHLILFNYSLYRCFLQMWIYRHMAFKPKGVSKRVIRILFGDLKTKPFVQQLLSSTACEWRSW